MVAHISNPSTQEVEVQELEASLGYTETPCLKKKKKKDQSAGVELVLD
jgi:hypothetical protein